MKETALKLAALFSSCGGPLFVFGLLKPRLGPGGAFFMVYLPVGLMLVGSFFLEDDVRDRLSGAIVRAGCLGLSIALGMHLYALWCFIQGVRVAEMYLYYFGIAVGGAWTIAYLRAARRWAARPGGASNAHDGASTEPIEPA